MKASFVAAAAFAAGSQALSYGYGSNVTVSVPDVYTTKVVTALTTVCPTPTQITVGGKTYTVSTSTTLTITNCPCTISYKASSAPPASIPATSVPKPPVTTAVYTPGVPSSPAPGKPSSPAPYYPSSNGTVVYSVGPTGTSAPTTTAPPKFTGAATKVGAGAMAIVAAAAAFL